MKRKAADVLNKITGIKIKERGRKDLGIPGREYWATNPRVEEAQKALYDDLLELVGEDEEDMAFRNRPYKTVSMPPRIRNKLKREIRTKLAQYLNQEGEV